MSWECASFLHHPHSNDKKHNYPPTEIWNANESSVQTSCNDDALVVASRGVRQVYIITPNEHEHLSVLSCINVAGESIPNF